MKHPRQYLWVPVALCRLTLHSLGIAHTADALPPTKPNLIVIADARSFLETGLPIFTNDNAARRQYRLASLLVYRTTITASNSSTARTGAGS